MIPDLSTAFIFGAEQLGGHNWGKYDPQAINNAIECALHYGVRYFDTADCYGNGESEKLLGKHFLKNRSDKFISTKFGVRVNNRGKIFYDSSTSWCEEALHNSLKRLNTDYIDLFQLHHWDGTSDIYELTDTLEKLKRKGLIKNFGYCNINLELILKIYSKNIFSYSANFSLINNSNEKAAKVAISYGSKFLPYGVLGQGILSGKYNYSSVFPSNDRRSLIKYKNFHGEGLRKSLQVVDELKKISQISGFTPSQLSIIWALNYLNNSIPIIGIKNIEQIMSVIKIIGRDIDKEIIDKLNSIYYRYN
jgi:myo-inositol catabolism protein IolS